MIDEILAGLVGGFLSDRALRLVRPKKKSEFDSIPIDELRRRNNWIDIGGSLIGGGALVLIWFGLVSTTSNATAWRVGLLFCFPVSLTLFFVCVVTLPKGIKRFREFWRYHELKHRTRLAVMLSLYIPFAALGLVSAFKILA